MHIALGASVFVLFILFICWGGPASVIRFVSGIGCLLLIVAGLIALLVWIASMTSH